MFITLEGPEGGGKTLQTAKLGEFLRQQGYPALLTREPGGTPIGDQVRVILGNLDNTAMRPRTEILLFQASRAQLVEEVIRPYLEGAEVGPFRVMAAELERLRCGGTRLHTALRYGISQALLDARALARGITKCEVGYAAYGQEQVRRRSDGEFGRFPRAPRIAFLGRAV